jgi:hypothetical protein
MLAGKFPAGIFSGPTPFRRPPMHPLADTASQRRTLIALGLLLAFSLSACSPVAFYEKGRLQDELLVLEDDPTEVHAYQKIYYSREGSVGGIGVGAGGGCGCY